MILESFRVYLKKYVLSLLGHRLLIIYSLTHELKDLNLRRYIEDSTSLQIITFKKKIDFNITQPYKINL